MMSSRRKSPRIVAALISLITSAQATFVSATSPAPVDWSRAVVESTMQRYPTAESLKGWGYAKSLYLYGVYLVYLRTKDKRYLDHIQSWVELHIDEKGTINRPINALDYMLPGNLLLILYKETKQPKYKLAADSIRKTFDTYPAQRTAAFGMQPIRAGNGSCGPTVFSCRCRFSPATERCS